MAFPGHSRVQGGEEEWGLEGADSMLWCAAHPVKVLPSPTAVPAKAFFSLLASS